MQRTDVFARAKELKQREPRREKFRSDLDHHREQIRFIGHQMKATEDKAALALLAEHLQQAAVSIKRLVRTLVT